MPICNVFLIGVNVYPPTAHNRQRLNTKGSEDHMACDWSDCVVIASNMQHTQSTRVFLFPRTEYYFLIQLNNYQWFIHFYAT